MKHTPGPWLYSEHLIYPCGAYGEDKLVKHGSKSVAMVRATGNAEETEANAKLIAAAPELLEALQDCRDILTDVFKNSKRAAIIRADAAIQKATGG